MTRVVAIDTATPVAEVCCVEIDGDVSRVVGTARRDLAASHAIHLTGMLDAALAEAGWPRDRPDRIVAVRGPGSFTGVRIGLGAARGLAFASGRPLHGIDRLLAMASRAGDGDRPRIPLIRAGRGEVYAAVFAERGSAPGYRVDPCLARPGRLVREHAAARWIVDAHDRPLVELLGAAGAAGAGGVVETIDGGVAAAAAALPVDPDGSRGSGLSPLYIRPADAEVRGPR